MDTRPSAQDQIKPALAGAFIGTGWIFWGNLFIHGRTALWGSLVVLVASAVLGGAIFCARRLRKRIDPPAGPCAMPFRGLFWSVVALEIFLACGSVGFLVATHRAHLIPIVLAIIVGLHFLPLAKALGRPPLALIGSAMVAIALACLAIPDPDLRNAAACFGIGLFMWTRTFVVLCRLRASLTAD